MDNLNPELAAKLQMLKEDGSYAAQSFARTLLQQALKAKQVTRDQYSLLVKKSYCWNSLKSLVV